MQSADHRQGQRTLAVQHLVDPVLLANDGFEIFDGQAALLHPELDRLDRVRRDDGDVLGLVSLHQRDQDV